MKLNLLLYKLSIFLINGITNEGGWGAETGAYSETNPLNTGEVLCGLIASRHYLISQGLPLNYDVALDKGIKYLIDTQLLSGGWGTGSAYIKIKQESDKLQTTKGNTVSTCFAIWALCNYSSICINKDFDEIIKNIIKKTNDFIDSCERDNGLYSYNPDLSETSIISSTYVLLICAVILTKPNIISLLLKEDLLLIENRIIRILDEFSEKERLNSIKEEYISAILTFVAIQMIRRSSNKKIPERILKKTYTNMSNIINNLDESSYIDNYNEKQTVIETGKKARDFIHYTPVWLLVAFSLDDDDHDVHSNIALRKIVGNISSDFEGVFLAGKRYTWTTGLTMLSISTYMDNYNINNLLKKGDFIMANRKAIFVVHGRDVDFKNKMFNFLRTIGLEPLDWNEIIKLTGNAAPTTFEIVNKGLEHAQAILVLLTGDDEARLLEEFQNDDDSDIEKVLTPQPRLNVVFEAGLSFAISPERTILVKKSKVKKFSDVDGINYILFNGTQKDKNNLINRLKIAGCEVDTTNNDWLDITF